MYARAVLGALLGSQRLFGTWCLVGRPVCLRSVAATMMCNGLCLHTYVFWTGAAIAVCGGVLRVRVAA